MISGVIPEQIVFGLDIGTRSVVGTVGYKRNTREFTVIAQAVRFHETRAMLDGQIHDISSVAETISQVKRELEEKIGRELNEVCIAAAGRVLKTVTVRTDYDLGDELVISDEMIRSMELIGVDRAHDTLRKKEKAPSGFFCVGYSVVKYYLGDIPISNLEGHKGSRIGADILATFLPEDVIDGLYAATGRAGLNVVNLTLEPIAAINLAIPEKFRLLNLALIDVGAGTSDICITRDGSVVAYGMLPSAGDLFSETLMQQYLVDFATAETIKLAASSKRKKVSYRDVMGLKKTVDTEEVRKVLEKPVRELTKQIAAKINDMNGGKNVSAIFIVGGGGKGTDFVKLLSEAAKLPAERVALRGEEVLTDIRFLDEKIVKDPTLVTPIGICLNYYEQNNNFIFVKINGELVKLYDNGRLTVMDAALAIGITSDKLFPARGDSLEYFLNGERRLVRGEAGEPAGITVNKKAASISTPIVQNDVIVVKPSTAGEPASLIAGEIPETHKTISFLVNSKKLRLQRLLLINGELSSVTTAIKNGDVVKVLDYYTVDKLAEAMELEKTGVVLVNNIIALGDEKIYENFTVDFGLENAEEHELDKAVDLVQDESVKAE